MCTAGDWILVVAIHLSDRGSFLDRERYEKTNYKTAVRNKPMDG